MKKIVYIVILFLSIVLICGCTDKTDDEIIDIKVSFDSDGGNSINTIKVGESGKIEEPENPIKDGYIFDGWYLDNTLFDFDSTITKSISLKANWIEAVYIYFTGSGFENYEIVVAIGSSHELPILEREGYVFNGWINDETNDIVDNEYIYEEDTVLKASWTMKERFAYDYYYNSEFLITEYSYSGETYTPYVYNMDGFTFNGWYLDNEYTQKFDFTTPNRSNKLYGKFVPNTYKISFSTSSITLNATYGSRVGTLPIYNITGCTFKGWEYDGQMINSATYYLFTKDIILTPTYQTKSTFVVDENTSKTVTYIVGDVTPYVSLEKEGYIFAGWYGDSSYSGSAIYVIETTDYANKKLYAKWVQDDSDNALSNHIVSLVKEYYTELFENAMILENLDLVSKDPFYGCSLTWSSNNNDALQNNGIIKRVKENVSCKLTLGIKYGSITETLEFDVTIKGQPYKDISKSVIAAYVYTGTYNNRPVDDILLETVDIINLSFMNPQSDGSLIIGADYESKLNAFYTNAYNKGVRVLMCVGGSGTASVFDDIAKDDIIRAIFVENIMNAIKKYNFAGVDIDWEYPEAANSSRYTLLMKDIYEAVKEYDSELLVTSAIPAGPWGYPRFELPKSIKYLDYLNLMSYDLQCSEEGYGAYHHSALYKSSMTYNMCSIEETVNYFNKYLSVPLNKIVIGAAFYGRYSTVTSLGGKITSGIVGSSMRYDTIYNNYLTNNTNANEYWDSTAYAPYIYDSNSKYFISYDNVRSIQAKCDYVISKKVAGIMWWDYGSDGTGTLINAINSKLSKLK